MAKRSDSTRKRTLFLISGQKLGAMPEQDTGTVSFLASILTLLLGAFDGDIIVVTPDDKFRLMGLFSEVTYEKEVARSLKVKASNSISRTVGYLKCQLTVCKEILRAPKADVYVFFLAQTYTLPISLLKILKRNVLLIVGASYRQLSEYGHDWLLQFPVIEQRLNFWLADRVVLYSPNLIKEWNLERLSDKITIASRHYLDLDNMKVTRNIQERDNVIGFIGRFSEEKGVMSFIQAVPIVLNARRDVHFSISGQGKLRRQIVKYLKSNDLCASVELTDWVPHERISECLNSLKLLVLPSSTEGLSNTMLEAMASGTPILTTKVGGAMDLIKDGETGFLLESSTPECIAHGVLRVLDLQLDVLTANASNLIRKEFSYAAAVQRYEQMFSEY